MTSTGGARAWRFLKRNPDYIEAQGKAPAAAPGEPAPFPIRAQTRADLDAAPWGLMAWEDPLDGAGPAAPFWTDAPALRGFQVAGEPPLAELLEEPGVRLSGLRIANGPAIVKVEQGEAAVHVRFDDGEGFDPRGGIVYGFSDGLDLGLRLRRAADLWPIAAAETKKDTGAMFASPTRSCCWSSTAGWPEGATA